MKLVFSRPHKLINMNDRLHWTQRRERTAEWRKAAYYAAVPYQPQPPSRIQVWLPVRTPNARRDPTNFQPTVKAIVDGLVDAKLWPDDTDEYTIQLPPKFITQMYDNVIVDITPIKGPYEPDHAIAVR